MIYLDSAATTKTSQRVIDVMLPCYSEYYGNPGSLHSAGTKATKLIDIARKEVSSFLDCKPTQIIFTSGGSEANTLAILGMEQELLKKRLFGGRNRIVTTKIEHPSVLKCMERLERDGFCVDYLPVYENGSVNIEAAESLIDEETSFVSVMYSNNETGAVNDVPRISELCSSVGALFHTDCVQAAGCEKVSANDIGADFISVSAHKIHGPKGVGCLYANNKRLLSPVIVGGEQEFGLRAGTENVPGIVGFGVAAKIAEDSLNETAIHVATLRQQFILALQKKLGDVMHVNGEAVCRAGCKTLNVRFSKVEAESLLLMLSGAGIYASAGSACMAHSAEPSHVLRAMGLTDEQAHSSVRFSFSKYNTAEEINYAANAVARFVRKLRGEENA